MAASPLNSKISYHARSISLPNRSHPIADQFDDQLSRLRSSQTSCTSSSSSISQTLISLKCLYDCIDELLLLPVNQKSLLQDRKSKWVDDMLDESLRLIDICALAKDALVQTKEHTQNIQSLLRRRCGGELSNGNEIEMYLNARKKVKKAIKNCLKSTKKAGKNDETIAMVGMLKDVEELTAEIFKSLLIHIGGSKTQSTKNGWSIVSKLVSHNSEKENAASTSEFEELDIALSSLIYQKKKTGISLVQVEKLRSQIERMESEIQDLDEVLESLCRHLVKTRATLLNTISN